MSSTPMSAIGFSVAAVAVADELLGDDGVDRQRHLAGKGVEDALRFTDEIGLGKRIADSRAGREQKGVGDASADDQRVDLRHQRVSIDSLVDTLEPATMATSGRAGCASALPNASSSAAINGPAHATGANAGDAVRRRFGTMRRTEGVVDVDVAQVRHLPRELVVVLLLADVEAAVLEQHDLVAGPSVPSHAPPSTQSRISGTSRPQQLATSRARDRRQRVAPRSELSFVRSTKMRGDHRRAHRASSACLGSQARDARMRVSSVIAPLIVLRHVEVGADEDALARQRCIGESYEGHG